MTPYPPVPGGHLDAEHDAWVREMWAKWSYPGEPAPCECGYWSGGGLVLCQPDQRAECRATVQVRLARHWREHHQRQVRARRTFPGPAHDGLGAGHCRWCGEDILREDDSSRLNLRRTWHPACFHQFNLHTHRDTQVAFLLKRDGPGCGACGAVMGQWERTAYSADHERDPDYCRAKDAWWRRILPPDIYVALYCPVAWTTSMEVDHVTALGRVAHLTDEERRPFFGPDNLQLLCVPCHQAKTVADRAAIKAVRVDNPLPPTIPFASEEAP